MTNKELLEWVEDWRIYCVTDKSVSDCETCDAKARCEQAYQSLKSLLEVSGLVGEKIIDYPSASSTSYKAQEPTDEEKKEMLNWLCKDNLYSYVAKNELFTQEYNDQMRRKIRSLILAKKPKVNKEFITEQATIIYQNTPEGSINIENWENRLIAIFAGAGMEIGE